MVLFFRQIWTLTVKNLLVILVRPLFTTVLRALILPIFFVAFISYARNLFIQPATYGIGEPTRVRSFADALDSVGAGRNRLIFVHNGLVGGPIERVIQEVAEPARTSRNEVHILADESEVRELCRTSLRGMSRCIAAVVFHSSPTEGRDEAWNYTIRTDAVLGEGIDVESSDNDQEIYLLPFQRSIDWAIARTNASFDANDLPENTLEYPFTSMNQDEREDQIRTRYMGAIIDVIAVAIFIGIVGVTYQLTGLIAMERELGMSQLIDCMMPNSSPWVSQAARFCAAHLALDIVYGPGWIIMGGILKAGVYSRTSAGITVVHHILTGLALSSFALFGASFFKKAQLSGISVVLACLLLGVVAQMVPATMNGPVIILGLLFPSMNYVYFSIFLARWERENLAAILTESAPNNPWSLPGIALWVFLVVQIIAYPILAAVVERLLYGTTSKNRQASDSNAFVALSIRNFTKIYQPGWFYRTIGRWFGSNRQTVCAVKDLSIDVSQGQIMVLLGANGSGKSTTLDAIAGLSKLSSGEISINYGQRDPRFGLCPQKNVLWDNLTVMEHVRIFNRLKSTGKVASEGQLTQLLKDCDLGKKVKARSKTLSGGQKRKVQLAMMFTGGSSVCCVDEVSSGIDPISRRKIWDILLRERGLRTIVLTTHFLDEADLLADHIAILSKGVLKANGSSVELKNRLGSGYRIHVLNVPGSENATRSRFQGIPSTIHFDETVYTVQASAEAARLVSELEQEGVTEYRVSGPTIEDVFLNVASELDMESSRENVDSQQTVHTTENGNEYSERRSLQLLTGQRISMVLQAWYLFRKRMTIFRRNPLPYIGAFLIPVVAAGLVTLFLKGVPKPGCSGDDSFRTPESTLADQWDDLLLVIGPSDRVQPEFLEGFVISMNNRLDPDSGGANETGEASSLRSRFHTVINYTGFTNYIAANYGNVTPGGVYIGDTLWEPTIAWKGDNANFALAAITQNVLDRLVTGIPINIGFEFFDIPSMPDFFDVLQLIVYSGLAMSVYPALFALYPNTEGLRNVRALHFSNGVRSLSLWLAYVAFDFCIVAASSGLSIIIFRAASDIWYHIEYLFVVFFLYGLCGILCSYLVSLFTRSQLAAFAFAAGGQCVLFLVYFIAYMSILTYAPTDKIDSYVDVAHYTVAVVSPAGSLLRALFTSLNLFSILCRGPAGREMASYPGEIGLYGGPILYLIIQSIFLFALLVWVEGGSPVFSWLQRTSKPQDVEEKDPVDRDIVEEVARVSNAKDNLRLLHVNKTFKKFVAVEDITFGVGMGEVFALLGPNGAGKTTTISLIRGDIQPTRNSGGIFVGNVSVVKHRAVARAHLGVCPQFDAMDQMTVLEHLIFYARIRGVPDITHNVREIMRAVGLIPFKHRMAAKLSGGNKRKLSLGIALMGNPSVLLLDEPSTGMDAMSKRVMWKTLAAVAPGRSIVLTTHSMEEADALAHRAGIMARRMLALGTTDALRSKYGNMYHVHLVHAHAPHTSDKDMENIRDWVTENFAGAVIEQKTYHGQLRFSVPADMPHEKEKYTTNSDDEKSSTTRDIEDSDQVHPLPLHPGGSTSAGSGTRSEHVKTRSSVSKLFSHLEQSKTALGVEHYSISQTTLDQVFLTIVGRHHIREEGSG
ncbi:putative ABC transporter [Aspergillus lucknowensis]|uniref:ABC transporter domain-containing protein n=1 Tax=Aspergillus lucknowensis TaxID=176173 RepID=A0ABR4LPC8_9EURO